MKDHIGSSGIITACVLLFFFPVSSPGQGKPVTVTGEVISIDEDENGNPTQVAIAVEQGSDCAYFYITLDKKGRRFLREQGNRFSIKGTVQRRNGEKWITIISWKSMPNPCSDKDEVFSDDTGEGP